MRGLDQAVRAFQLAEQGFGERMAARGALFDPALSVQAGLLAALPHIGLVTVAMAIADHSVRSEIELYAKPVLADDGSSMYRIDQPAIQEGSAEDWQAIVNQAVTYIEARDDNLPFVMRRQGTCVWFVDRVRSCRVCSCTDEQACPGGCSLVGQDLCSACADVAAEADRA
jgi:hypothetical protein